MCKPGFGRNTNFLKWMGQDWFPYISCNQLHVAGRLTVIYSNCLSSVYAIAHLHNPSIVPTMPSLSEVIWFLCEETHTKCQCSKNEALGPCACCSNCHSSKGKRVTGMLPHIQLEGKEASPEIVHYTGRVGQAWSTRQGSSIFSTLLACRMG